MRLINAKYKVISISNEDRYGSTVVVEDTQRGHLLKKLRIINYQKETQEFIDYMKLNMSEYRNLNHPNLMDFYFFSRVIDIDAKPVVADKYYYTYENFEGTGLFEYIKNQEYDTLLDLSVQLCSLVKYLHMKGFLLCSVKASELFAIHQKDRAILKVSKLPYIRDTERTVMFDREYNHFMSPEVFQFGDYSKASDIYLIGAIMFYIFDKSDTEGFNFKDELERFENSEDNRIAQIAEIIKKCTTLRISDRYESVDGIVSDINKRLGLSFNIADKKLYQRLLRYNTRLVSREHHIDRVLESAKGYLYENKLQPRVTVIKGLMGTGRSVFIKAANYRLEQEGIPVIFNSLKEEADYSFYYIVMVIKEIMKNIEKEIVDKYIKDISYIIPEITNMPSSSIYSSVIRQEDKVRLVYRLGNFILEASSGRSFVMAIGGFNYIDEDSLSVLNYIIRSEGKGRIYFLFGTGTQGIEENAKLKDFYGPLEETGYIDYIELSNLNIKETEEYIRLLLGMDEPVLDFAAKIYKETEGNPKLIYEIIYFLFMNNLIYVNEEGGWVLNRIDLSSINLSFNISDLILNKVSKLSPLQKKIVRTVSIFNTAVSPDILKEMIDIDMDELETQLSILNSNNMLSKKVDDWGISFDFSSINLKKSIYERIPEEIKQKSHLAASYILEDKFSKENRENKDELIFHMTKSKRYKEAIEHLMKSAEKMISSNLLNQGIQFLLQSYDMFTPEDVSIQKMIVCSKLGELYEQIGEYGKSMHFYGMSEIPASKVKDLKMLIDIYIKKASLSYKAGNRKEAIRYAVKAKRLLKDISYPKGLCELIISLNHIMSNKRKYSSYIKILENTMNNIDIEKYEHFYARIMVIYGKIICNKNRFEEGLSLLLKGMEILERLSEYKYIPFALNAIGVIYSDYYNDIPKSREYFERCLDVGQKVNDLTAIEKSYNNIAELYRIEDLYGPAIEYYNKALETVRISQNVIVKILININLIIANTEMGDFKKAYMYMGTSEDMLTNLKDSWNLQMFLYHHKADFYYALGDYEKAIQFAQKTMYICTTWGIPENVEVYFVKLLSEIQKSGILDYEKDSSFINKVFKENSYKLGRIACVRLAEIYIEKGRKEQGAGFLNRGLSYASKIDTDILRLRYDYVGALIKEGPERLESLTKLTGLIETTENNEIGWKIYKAIALEYTERGDHREALKYLITSLSYLRKLVHNVPDEYKIEFINSHGRNSIKESLRQTAKLLAPGSPGAESKGEGEYEESTSLNEMDKYFDYTEYRNIYRQNGAEEVSAAISMEANTRVGFLERIQELLNRFSDDERFNLKQIIDLLADMTQAKNAFIAVLQEDESLKVIASYRRYSEIPFYKYVVEQVKQKKESIIVSDVFEYNARKGDILIPNNITAVFCIPIMLPKESEGIEAEQGGERRKHQDQGNNTIAGYIYLDTDSIINNFTLESSCFCITASKIAYVLTDNYNMKAMSTIDKLTKLYTRKYFETKLSNELGHVEREGGQFSIIMADIDKFKSVNDRFGHQKGDEVLQGISSIIMNNVRKGDLCGRYGGEEIIMLLPGTDSKGAYKVAEKIRKKVENSKLMGLNIPLTISLGISSYPEHGTWAKDLVDKADQALYNVKESGRNGSRIYELNMPNSTNRIGRLEGIVSGDLVEDQRKARTLLEILELQRDNNKTIEEKMFSFLGRIIEVSEAHTGGIFLTEEMSRGRIGISRRITRKRLAETEIGEASHNEDIIEKCISSRRGEYQIDWSSYPGIDSLTGMPDWQSVISIPMIDRGKLKGVVYLSVSIKDKEFDAGTYNYIKILSDIMSAAF